MSVMSQRLASPFGGLGTGSFPDPFIDVASLAVPATMRSMLYWAEHIFSVQETYRMAMERVISYFLTDVVVKGTSKDEKEKWDDFMEQRLGVIPFLKDMLRDCVGCYGNGFASVVVPFKRFLACPKCHTRWTLAEVYENHKPFAFSWSIPKFTATCPVCAVGRGYRGEFVVKDEKDDVQTKVRLKRWNPHEMELLHDPYTHEVAYLWRIPEDYKRMVRTGHLFHLERAPKEVIQAIYRNQMYRFDDDAVFHMKESTLGGILNRGWGIPRIFTNFRMIWYLQVLRRFNEAIALDYVIPFRLITPAPRPGASGPLADPLQMWNGNDFRAQVRKAIRDRRRDPCGWQVLPFPVNYQMLGAEANKLAPRDLFDQGNEQLLNGAGVPIELYKGSLQLQTAPVALRLFESTWAHLVHDSNACLRWLGRQIARALSWEEVELGMKRVTVADDLQKTMFALQLMTQQQLSGTTALAALGYDWPKEQQQMAEEARQQGEIQMRTQEEMRRAGEGLAIAQGQLPGGPGGAGGQQPPADAGGSDPSGGAGGAPPPGAAGADPSGAGLQPGPVTQYIQGLSPQTPVTPQDLQAAAQSIANDLLGRPSSVAISELRKLRQANPALHALVRQIMDQIRRDTRQAAGNQALAARQQQGGAAA